MSLTKAKGNMYPWVTHTHSLLAGQCPHGCSYCYVQAMARRFPNLKARYSGPVNLLTKELQVTYPRGDTVFIEHLSDLFALGVPRHIPELVLQHCRAFPDTTFVFQTKNPCRYHEFLGELPARVILGTTVESNRHYSHITAAIYPAARAKALGWLPTKLHRFLTIEPILDFDLPELLALITIARPDFINLGADSKGCGLPEPSKEKLQLLLNALSHRGVEVRQKTNLARLLA